MSDNRVYVYTTIFGVPITGIRNLWEPKTEYQGKKQEKPSYITSIIVPKTRAHWSEEPAFAGFAGACTELFQKALAPKGIQFAQVQWPVKDGDVPEPGKAVVDWMRGQWFLSGSSSSQIKTELAMADGSLTTLANANTMVGTNGVPVRLPAPVKPGDIVTLSGAIAVKTNNPLGVKFYTNNVVFMNPGQEIAIGNGITGAELMQRAREQGLNVTGFTPGGGGFGGGQVGGFAPPAGTFGGPGDVQAGFAQGGFGGAPAPVQPVQQGGFQPPAVAPQPAPQAGFAPSPGGFQPPAGFPQR